MDKLVTQKEGHVFRCYFFTQNIRPTEFTLHEVYYYIENGEVKELESDCHTGDNPLEVILGGEDLGVEKTQLKRKMYHFSMEQFKKWHKELF